METNTAHIQVIRFGTTSRVLKVWTGDKDVARAAADEYAATVITPKGLNYRISRIVANPNTYHTAGYDGPAVTVSIKFWK